MLALGTAECRVPARGLLYEVELLVGVAAQWMPAMEQQNSVFQLKGCSTRWEDLGGRLLAVFARMTLATMVMVVIAVVVACLGGFYVRVLEDFR